MLIMQCPENNAFACVEEITHLNVPAKSFVLNRTFSKDLFTPDLNAL